MTVLARALWNPIVAKEFRSRMRTWRSSVAVSVYILLLAGLAWGIFASMAGASSSPYGPPSTNYGQMLFAYLVIFQMVLLAFVTPALTAGAISGERERQTIDLLFVTLIPPFAIVWGKLLASISFILLLLLLSVPIFSLVFLFGGIEPDQVLHAFLLTAVTALTLGTIGIACSIWLRRTLAATVAAYGAAFVMLAGSVAYGLLLPTEFSPNATTPPAPPLVTYLGPFLPLVTIATNSPPSGYGVRLRGGGFGGGGMVCSSAGNGPPMCLQSGGAVSNLGRVQSSPLRASGPILPSGPFTGWQYWEASVAMQLGICVVAVAVSAFLLPPVRRFRPWRSRGSHPGGLDKVHPGG